MKKRILGLGLLAALAVTTLSCEKKTETATAKEETVKEETVAVDKDKIKTEIEALETGFATAMNAGDADAVATYYADDATSYGQNKAPASGKATILENLKKEIAESKGMKVTFATNEVHISNDGNQVVEIGSYRVVDATNKPKYTGNFMAVFEKRDGKYVCVRDMSASDMPQEK